MRIWCIKICIVLTLQCIQEVDRFGGGSVMVWGVISHIGRTALVHVNGTLTAQRYCDKILQHHVVPIMQNNSRLF